MSCPLSSQKIAELRAFVTALKAQPQILHAPEISFFKEYLNSLGAVIPPPSFKPEAAAGDRHASQPTTKPAEPSSEEDVEPESDVELDNEGVIEGDELESSQEMGDPNKESTEEEIDQSDEKRGEAMAAFAEQDFGRSLQLYTEAIKLNPNSALLFAKRGQVYLKLNKPNACIKDCSRALELNCDSAAAYKFRGRAYRLLGKWEESAHDLRESCKIDFDEQANEWLSEVTPNAEKLRQHKLNQQRKKEEKEHRDKLRQARKVQEARSRAAQEAAAAAASAASAANEPSPDHTDTKPGDFNASSFENFLKDPDVLETIRDPEVISAIQDMSTNPSNIFKYMNNQKVMAAIQKIQEKLDKKSAGGGFPAGFPGFGGAGAAKPPNDDDVGLD